MKVRLFIALSMVFLSLLDGHLVFSMEPGGQVFQEDVARKVKVYFANMGRLMSPLDKEGRLSADEIRLLETLSPRFSQYWEDIQQDISDEGQSGAWIASLQVHGIITQEEKESVKLPYQAFCKTLKEKDFLKDPDCPNFLNLHEYLFKSPEFLRDALGEEDLESEKEGMMFFPLIFKERQDFRMLIIQGLQKSINHIVKGALSPSFKQNKDSLRISLYKVYLKWRAALSVQMRSQKAVKVNLEGIPEDIKIKIFQEVGDHESSLIDDICSASENASIFFQWEKLACQSTTDAHAFCFKEPCDFFENLARRLQEKLKPLRDMHKVFQDAQWSEDPPRHIRYFNRDIETIFQNLEDLKVLFGEKKQRGMAQAENPLHGEFSLGAFDRTLRALPEFSPQDTVLYCQEVFDFYHSSWRLIKEGILGKVPLSIERCYLNFTIRRNFIQRKGLEQEISTLGQRLKALEEALKQKDQLYDDLQGKFKDLKEKKAEKEKSSRAKSSSQEEEKLREALSTSQREIASLKADLKQFQTEKEEFERGKDLAVSQALQDAERERKAFLQRESEKLRKSFGEELKRASKEIQKKSDDLRTKFQEEINFLKACFRLVPIKSGKDQDLSGEALRQALQDFKQGHERLLSEKNSLEEQVRLLGAKIQTSLEEKESHQRALSTEKTKNLEQERSIGNLQEQLRGLRRLLEEEETKTSVSAAELENLRTGKIRQQEMEREIESLRKELESSRGQLVLEKSQADASLRERLRMHQESSEGLCDDIARLNRKISILEEQLLQRSSLNGHSFGMRPIPPLPMYYYGPPPGYAPQGMPYGGNGMRPASSHSHDSKSRRA